MKRILKKIGTILLVLIPIALSVYLFISNVQLHKEYEAATTQITSLQAKLNAVGTFTDVWTIKGDVNKGDEIVESDLEQQTVPTSSAGDTVLTNKDDLVGKFYRLDMHHGVTLTSDLIMEDPYEGATYSRDLCLDSFPVGLTAGDYVDIRVVLPGGGELNAMPHKRVNMKLDNAISIKLDEAGLALYTSMLADNALYADCGFKIYCTKYTDPGMSDTTVQFYPIRKEVADIVNLNPNMTDKQKQSIQNATLRDAIDAKLKHYSSDNDQAASKLSQGVQDEQGKINEAEQLYKDMQKAVEEAGTNLEDPNGDATKTSGTAGTTDTSGEVNAGGVKDAKGNASTVKSEEYLKSIGDNLYDDESTIQ